MDDPLLRGTGFLLMGDTWLVSGVCQMRVRPVESSFEAAQGVDSVGDVRGRTRLLRYRRLHRRSVERPQAPRLQRGSRVYHMPGSWPALQVSPTDRVSEVYGKLLMPGLSRSGSNVHPASDVGWFRLLIWRAA